MRYEDRTVFIPAHYRTIRFVDFGRNFNGSIEDAIEEAASERLRLFYEIVKDESSNQFGLLLKADFGKYEVERRPVIYDVGWQRDHIADIVTTARIQRIIYSWNLNYYKTPNDETLRDVAERIVTEFNSKYGTDIQLYNNIH